MVWIQAVSTYVEVEKEPCETVFVVLRDNGIGKETEGSDSQLVKAMVS
jgi:hypothetical protein